MSLKDFIFTIFGGKTVRFNIKVPKVPKWPILSLFIILIMSTGAFAQGSVFGIVANSDLSTPANGQVTFVGYLDDTDEEIRIELSDGAGYDAGNWFDDFQNYLTEAPGNPYDYHFYNTANGEGFQLSKLIPNNSFQQENILLAAIAWPTTPAGLSGVTLSGSSVLVTWNFTAGNTYHVYRRLAISSGSFFRVDDPTGSLSNPGVADSIFIDNTVDGLSSYDYIIIAEDISGNLSPHSAFITVNSSVVDAPVLTSIDPNSDVIQGGLLVNLYGSGFDPAGVDIQFGTQLVSATVVTPYHLTMTTPTATAGAIDVYVTNTTSVSSSNTLVGGFTYDANTEPVLAVIGVQQTTEGVLLQFNTSATDLDGHIPVMTSSALPGTAAYVDNGDGTGTFNWTPTYVDAGVYNVTFYATDGLVPSLIDSEQVQITIIEAGNQTPVLAAIGPQSGTENILLSFVSSASDVDGTIPTMSATALPNGATFVDNGDGTGTFNWTPDFTQAGTYDVTFSAYDGLLQADEIVTITINDGGNQTPVLAAIGPQAITENVLLSFVISATDVDGTIPTMTALPLPSGATFIDNGDGTGTFNWTPDFSQAGTYDVTFSASDGTAQADEIVTITVNEAGNQTPVLAAIGAQAITENILLSFIVSASDLDGTIPTLTALPLPSGATFVDNGDGTGTFNWTPDFTQAGTYDVTFSASDGTAQADEIVTITVNEAGNQTPVLAAIGAQAITENILLNFIVSASDLDGTIPTMTALPLPSGATFVDNGDGTGTFDWTPDFTQSGTYDVTFSASDGTAQADEIVTVTVNEAGNQTPVLAAIGPQGGTEDILLSFVVSASDPDGTIPALSAAVLPTGATFVDNGDGTGQFDWIPDFTQTGTYDVTFSASDGTLQADEIITITINDAGNQAPVLAAIGPQTGTENILLSFAVSASDLDGTIPTLSALPLPGGATFTDNGDGTGQFDWTPDFTQAGTFDVTFSATDGTLQADEIVTITINDGGNQLPILTAIGAQGATEDVLLSFVVIATDADGTFPILTAAPLPTGATFIDNGDGTGQFDWTPDFTQAGIYDITFSASDGIAQADEIVTITVVETGNQAPVLATIGAQSISENNQLLLNITAVDPDGTFSLMTTSTLPAGATFVDNLDGTALFDWTPDFTQDGIYNVMFYASDGVEIDSELVSITVIDAGNQTPVWTTIGPQTISENILLTFVVTASDGDGTFPVLTTSTLPVGAVFVDNGDGTGQFDWTPDFTQSGIFNVTFSASDGVTQADEFVTITVTEVGNQIPVLDTILDVVTSEGSLVNFVVTASDPESIPTLTTSVLPTGATFIDNADGTGTFDWTPGFTQAGSYDITFFADDDSLIQVSQLMNILVNESGSQAPIITVVTDTSVVEGDVINIDVTASDPDGGLVVMSISTSLNNYTFVDNGDGTALLTYSPDFYDAGVESIVFLATDNDTPQQTGSAVLEMLTLEFNQAPIFDTSVAGPYAVDINETLDVSVIAYDSTDGNQTHFLILTAIGMPINATFSDNNDGTGNFSFSPLPGQEGVDTVTFLATDMGNPQLSVTLQVEITAVPVNSIPVLDTIGPQTILEGDILTLNISATDADLNIPYFTADLTNLGGNGSMVDNGDGTAVFTFSPSFTQAGLVYVTFKAHDGIDFSKEVVLIQIYEAGDQIPRFYPMPDTNVTEGDTGVVVISAYDPDELPVTITVFDTTMPPNFVYEDSGNGSGILTMTPDYTQAGIYIISFEVSDGVMADTTDIIITIDDAGNQLPVMGFVSNTSIQENSSLTFDVIAADLDGIPVMSLASPDLPAAAITGFVDNGDGTGTFNWTPGYFDEGVYSAIFYAIDDIDPAQYDSVLATITVTDLNRTPWSDFPAATPDSLFEGDTLYFTIVSWDLDSTIPVVTAYLDGSDTLATNMNLDSTYVDVVNGWRFSTLMFTPDYTQGSEPTATFYDIRFKVCDELDDTLCVETNPQTFRVYNNNQPPEIVFNPVVTSPITLNEGESVQFQVIATDDAALPDSLVVRNLPAANATFTGAMQNSKSFTFNPDFTQSGLYSLIFVAYDNAGDSTAVNFDINVVEAGNQVPTFTTVLTDTIPVLYSNPSATILDAVDLDMDSISVSAIFTAANMSFSWTGAPGSATGTFNFFPDVTQVNTDYPVTFIVTDIPAGAADTINVYYHVWPFLRGDSDSDSRYSMNDIVYLINYLFKGGAAPNPISVGDANNDGSISINDISFLVNFLYNGGPTPPQ